MVYQFDEQDALLYGVDAAIMLYNFHYWIRKNEANGTHFHEGRFWTYNSVAAYAKLFPFWTERQVRYILDTLVKSGVLLAADFNENRRDRSKWYAFSDEYLAGIRQNCQEHSTNLSNGSDKIVKCKEDSIYNNKDIYTDKLPDNNGGKPPKHARTAEKLCLFADSRFADFDAFAAEFAGPNFQGIDIMYYFNAVADWSAQGAKKKHDWIATARNFMRGDAGRGQLKKVHAGGSPLTQEYLKFREDHV